MGRGADPINQLPAERGARGEFPPDCFLHLMTAEGGVGWLEE